MELFAETHTEIDSGLFKLERLDKFTKRFKLPESSSQYEIQKGPGRLNAL
jgi:hypothetical protein